MTDTDKSILAIRLSLLAKMIEKHPDDYGVFFLEHHAVGLLSPFVSSTLERAHLIESCEDGWKLTHQTTLEQLTSFMLDGPWKARTRHELLSIVQLPHRALERGLFRPLGLKTQAVRLIISDDSGHFLLAQRSHTKMIAPGLWDNIAAGLVAAGETPREAMIREAKEECNLTLSEDKLTLIGSFTTDRHEQWGWLSEETFVFQATPDSSWHPKANDGEVEAFARFSLSELLAKTSDASLLPEGMLALLLSA